MLIISRLDKILKDKKISKKELFESIELTRQGFDYAIKNDSLRVKDLESIANFLNVPVSYFFGEEAGTKKINIHESAVNIGNGTANNKTNAENELEKCRAVLEAKEREIALYKEMIAILKEKK